MRGNETARPEAAVGTSSPIIADATEGSAD
jgi:hypothetical protein